MSTPQFDTEAPFDEDSLYFYGSTLDDTDRNSAEVDLITRLLDLQPGSELLDERGLPLILDSHRMLVLAQR